uniref:Heparan sulphate-N-deacetylase domain-containing protein n=1 Tax=Acrobeloides nanus TaxID=290746 RepID=A0A914EN07_9BILA
METIRLPSTIVFLDKVGIISFVHQQLIYSDLDFIPLYDQHALKLKFSARSQIPFIARADAILPYAEPFEPNWILFNLTHETEGTEIVLEAETLYGERVAAIIHDNGKNFGVESVMFGHSLDHWMIKIAFFDTLRYLLRENFSSGIDRYIQIDIDDIFVGQSGSRFIPEDVKALIHSQNELRDYIQDFHYNLGFSGYFFRHGDELENAGDEELVAFADRFLWFPHMWRHNHAHEFSISYLLALMSQNKLFAENTRLKTPLQYAISPQHSGVYPIHEALYEAWSSIWKVRVTSTEEYPHLKPASLRRGFIYKNISVLPRQTC